MAQRLMTGIRQQATGDGYPIARLAPRLARAKEQDRMSTDVSLVP